MRPEQTTEQTTVVVLGGGYAGVMAANRLMSRDDVRVVLVNPRATFVERIRLHQMVADTGTATVDFAAVLHPAVVRVVDAATRIDAPARRVELASGDVLYYDHLVYAVGSTGSIPSTVPGAAEFAWPMAELEQAERLRARLADASRDTPVVVVGGGLTGIEAAAEFAEAGRPVTLVSTAVAPSLSGPGRRSVRRRLRTLGVTIVDGPGAAVAAVGADHLDLANGRRLPSPITVWAAGFGVPGLAVASGLTVDDAGRLITDETLTSVDDPRVVAAGDAVSPSGRPYRMSCQAGLPLGAQAATTVLAHLAGRAADPATVAMTGQCVSVGRRSGTVQLQHRDDTPVPLYLGGRLGALVKEQVCRATVNWLAGEAATPGSYRALRGPRREGATPGSAVRAS
jgi:NADH dehydrogenase FAD-containing subunit